MPEDPPERPPAPPDFNSVGGDPLDWALERVDQILDEAAEESGLLDVEMPDPGQERRQAIRYSLEEPAQVEIESWAELLELYTKDISHNGIFIRTSSPPEIGTRVGVHLLLPDGTGTIPFQGKVVRVVAPGSGGVSGFGVKFYGVTQEARNTLQWIVAQAKAATKTPKPAGPSQWHLAGDDSSDRRASKREIEQAKRSRLRAVLCDLGARSDLEVLGLDGSPTLEQIDKAYKSAARQWDPYHGDRDASREVIKLSKAIHFRIERAYRRARAEVTFSSEGFANALSTPTLE